MPADDAAQGQDAPSRRGGRPPAAREALPRRRARRKRLGGAELTEQLNQMVAELIKENRKLKRQVVKLTERSTEGRPAAPLIEPCAQSSAACKER